MAGSDITVSSLVAVGDVKGNKLAWVVTDPWPKDMRTSLDAVELWAATSNDRAHGSFAKVGEGLHDFSHAGLNRGDVRYYWAKARNKYGSYGPWHPSGATSGVVGTEVSGDVLLLTDGYWKHSSGLIHQWGDISVAGAAFVSFPIAFPNGTLSVVATLVGAARANRFVSVEIVFSPLVQFGVSIVDGDGTNQTETIFWQAIGY